MGGELGGIVIGWRELVLAVIAAVVAYMLVVVLRMRRLRQPPPVVGEPAAGQPPAAEFSAPPEVPPLAEGAEEAPAPAPAFVQGVEAEVLQLREEVDALRGEVAALRDELHNELAHLRATQTVSPLYTDAMQMATLGHDAATIAERCGISRAEAELMVALVKNQEQ